MFKPVLALAGALLMVGTTVSVPATAAPSELGFDKPPSLEEVTVNLSPEDRELVLSGEATTLYVNSETAQIEEVSTEPEITPFIVQYSNCSGTQGCYFGPGTPYADYGFSGLGTIQGNWPQRTGYRGVLRPVSACSTSTCYGIANPGTRVVFNRPVTGVSFSIY